MASTTLPPALGTSNWRLRLVRQLDQRKHRDAMGLTLVEGVRLCETAALAGARFRMVMTTEQAWPSLPDAVAALQGTGAEFWTLEPELMDRVAPTASPSGLLGVVEIPKYSVPVPPYASDFLLLCLDDVADPGNAGTLVRSADAAGAAAVLLLGGVDVWNPKALRSTMGSCFHLPVISVPAGDAGGVLLDLKAAGVRIACAHQRAPQALWATDLRGPVAIVLGNEAHGLHPETIAAADLLVSIPNYGRVESLNVAQAGTVLLFEAARQISCASGRPQV